MIKHAMLFVAWGAPVWAWLVGFAVFAAQDLLSRSDRFKMKTLPQAIGNVCATLQKTMLGKFPVLGQLLFVFSVMKTPETEGVTLAETVKDVGRVAALLPVALLLFGTIGCATIYTPPGATTSQKIKDDLSAIGIVEADVKAQCGAQFAPLAAQAMCFLSIAEAAGNLSAYNIPGAVQNASIAIPVLAGDVQGLMCVEKVIAADYQKLKPKAAPPAVTPKPAAARPGYYSMRRSHRHHPAVL